MIQKIYRKSPILQSVYRWYYNNIHNYRINRQYEKNLELMRLYGLEALDMFNKCMKENHFRYSLAFGTLLGAVREHDFIPHDDDIDLSMWIEDYRPELIECLKKYGFKLIHSFSIDDERIGKEDTFLYKGILVDIFYFYREKDGRSYCCDFVNQPGCTSREACVKKFGGLLPRKLYLPYSEEFKSINFKGIELPIPIDYHQLLSCRYGDDYMIPRKGWRPTTDFIVEQHDSVGVYTEFEK